MSFDQIPVQYINAATAGFFLLLLIVWYFSSRSRRAAFEKENAGLTDLLKEAKQKASHLESEMGILQKNLQEAQRRCKSSEERLQIETSMKNQAEDKLPRIGALEKENSELASDIAQLRRKNADLESKTKDLAQVSDALHALKAGYHELLQGKTQAESQLSEARIKIDRDRDEMIQTSETLQKEVLRRSIIEDRLFRVQVIEKENSEIRDEILDLKATVERLRFQEKQIQEIRDSYQSELESNVSQKQQKLIGHIFEMKTGLEKAIEAFNQTIGLFDQRCLVVLTPETNAKALPEKTGEVSPDDNHQPEEISSTHPADSETVIPVVDSNEDKVE